MEAIPDGIVGCHRNFRTTFRPDSKATVWHAVVDGDFSLEELELSQLASAQRQAAIVRQHLLDFFARSVDLGQGEPVSRFLACLAEEDHLLLTAYLQGEALQAQFPHSTIGNDRLTSAPAPTAWTLSPSITIDLLSEVNCFRFYLER